jgi:endonuclease-8
VAACFDAPVVELSEQRARALHPALGRLGPDLLAAEPDIDEAIRRLRHPDRDRATIGVVLLDQRVVAGIGNEVRNEALWQAQCSPWWPAGELDDGALRRLFGIARDILREGARTGRRPCHVYRLAGRPCPRCGALIGVTRQGSGLPRLTFWCPACQAGAPAGGAMLRG